MRLFVDAWEPGYGTGIDPADDRPGQRSSAALDVNVELPAEEWRPLNPPPGMSSPDVVHVVDGVRRVDARVWLDSAYQTYPGLAASYAAGVVRCDLRGGVAELAAAHVERGLFTPAPDAVQVGMPPARYDPQHVSRGEPSDLVLGVQAQLRSLEVRVSTAVARLEELLIVDGPLRGRAHLPNALGYVKTHQTQYLPDRLGAVVTGLRPGQRSPIFKLGTSWHRYTWYLRLPGPAGSAWSGIVRVEAAAELPVQAVVELADMSAVTLPRFASSPYKDARAPQNLVPIAGLEKRLRALLGDARVLHRALVRAAAAGAPA
ncbi:MAG TPA: hypothetical protein VKB69_03125 [Micromonosporaceae bacterium]|nr:hypothetical protein [Micromonosporaceae bacterium]